MGHHEPGQPHPPRCGASEQSICGLLIPSSTSLSGTGSEAWPATSQRRAAPSHGAHWGTVGAGRSCRTKEVSRGSGPLLSDLKTVRWGILSFLTRSFTSSLGNAHEEGKWVRRQRCKTFSHAQPINTILPPGVRWLARSGPGFTIPLCTLQCVLRLFPPKKCFKSGSHILPLNKITQRKLQPALSPPPQFGFSRQGFSVARLS